MFYFLNFESKMILVLIFGMLFSYLLTKLWIYLEHQKGIHQFVREEMVDKSIKEKTPTMGGVPLFLATNLALLVVDPFLFKDDHFRLLFFFSIPFLCIGLSDDLLKIIKKNTNGISPLTRVILEILIIFLFLYFSSYQLPSEWVFHFPNTILYLGGFFLFISTFIILGSINAVNLSDGMDGLLGFLYLFSLLPFIIASLLKKEGGISLYLLALYGSIFSFLRFNMHPAKIFMGDVGSLYLGSIFAFVAYLLHLEYIIPIAGFLFMIEAISVILQVFFFKLKKKRIFLMTPIHHHFELKGVKEWKVVMVFALIGFIMSVISILLVL